MYSVIRKAEALAAVDAGGGNIAKPARIARVPERTLNSWVRKYQEPQSPAQPRDADQLQAARARIKAQLAERFEELAQRFRDMYPGVFCFKSSCHSITSRAL
jgi:transposase-like protein